MSICVMFNKVMFNEVYFSGVSKRGCEGRAPPPQILSTLIQFKRSSFSSECEYQFAVYKRQLSCPDVRRKRSGSSRLIDSLKTQSCPDVEEPTQAFRAAEN